MNITKTQVFHFLGLVATAVLGVIADQAGQSHWMWAPIVVALITNVKTIVGKAS